MESFNNTEKSLMTVLTALTQRSFNARMCLISTLVCLFCTAASAGRTAAEGFEVGHRWEYRHEGPRPGSMEPNAVDGERILHVIALVEGNGRKQWVIAERFTNDPNVTARLYVSEERMLTAVEIANEKGEAVKLRYDPPVPYQVTELEVGEKGTIETALRIDSADFALPSTIVTERLADETITTPAGEFVGCLHYKSTNTSTFDIKIAKIPFSEERERWYHPEVNGLVKEIYRKGPVKFLTWSRPGYTATSVLTSFGRQQPEAGIATTIRSRDGGEGKEEPAKRRSIISSCTTACVVLLGAIGILAIGGYVLAKRARRNRPARP
jgi:hypothetical protein